MNKIKNFKNCDTFHDSKGVKVYGVTKKDLHQSNNKTYAQYRTTYSNSRMSSNSALSVPHPNQEHDMCYENHKQERAK